MNVFSQHGKKMLFISRLVPTLRSIISLPAGLNRMDLKVFLFYTVLGTALWNIILMYAGIVLGQNWTRILVFVDAYEIAIGLILGSLALIFVVKRLRH